MADNKYKRENRIREALSLRGMKQVELCEKTGIKKSALNNWLSQRWQPKQEPLYKMARALDVSELWLAGYDIPMERPAKQKEAEELADIIVGIKEDPQLRRINSYLSKLSGSQRDIIENVMKEMLKPQL